VSIKTLASGVDVLGWIHFPNHRVLRTTTKRRAISRVIADPNKQRVASYVGMLKHGNAEKLKEIILEAVSKGNDMTVETVFPASLWQPYCFGS
jgi:hypothetical protein